MVVNPFPDEAPGYLGPKYLVPPPSTSPEEDVKALEAAELEARLFPPSEASSARPMPNWAEVHKELKG